MRKKKTKTIVNEVEGDAFKIEQTGNKYIQQEDILYSNDIISIAKGGFISLSIVDKRENEIGRYDCCEEEIISVETILKRGWVRPNKNDCAAALLEMKSPSRVYSQPFPIPNGSFNPGVFSTSFYDREHRPFFNVAKKGDTYYVVIENNTDKALFLELLYIIDDTHVSLFTNVIDGSLEDTDEQDWVVINPYDSIERFFFSPRTTGKMTILSVVSEVPIMYYDSQIFQYYSGVESQKSLYPLYFSTFTFSIK